MPPTFPRHAAVVAWAKNELGVHEDPMGSNTGPRVRYYQGHTWLEGTRWPWCAAFVDTAWEEGGGYKLPWPSAGAHNIGDLAHAAGWPTTVGQLIPGDLVDWNIGSGHISIFLAYENGKVHTIDGNVGDKVDYRVRSASLVRYAIHVPEKPKAVPAPAKPPMFEVVTSESGHAKVVYVSGQKAISRKLGQLLNRYGGLTIRRRHGGRSEH